MASTQIVAQSTEGDWDSENDDLWGGESHESEGINPIEIIEGVLDDHQDNDTFDLNSSASTIHNIRIESAIDPIHLEVWSGAGKLAEIEGVHGQVALVSGDGSNIQIEVKSVSFSGSNPYQIQVHSVTGDATVEVQPDFENSSNANASGYLHDTDSAGDVAIFRVGGNAPIEIMWNSFGEVNFSGHIIRISNENMTPFDLLGKQGQTTLQIPETSSGQEIWEIVIGIKSTGTGWWWIEINSTSLPDQHCSHDCSSIIDAAILSEDAFELKNDFAWSTHGRLSELDTADVYPIFIPGEYWETHRLIATLATPTAEGMEIQIQSWNNSAEFISVEEMEVGTSIVGLNMTPGYHFVIVRHGTESTGGDYYLILNTINITDEDDEPIDPNDLQDMWEKFTVFYIIIGVVLLAPFAWVMWTTRGNRMDGEIQAHERVRLRHLHSRLSKLLADEYVDETAIEDALGMLAAIQWRATEDEMGEAMLTHHTEAVTLKAWRIIGTKLLVGIHIEEEAWELAALRFEAIEGPGWKITDVSPKSLFDGDEIYLGTLGVGTTTFLHLTLEGRALGLDLHLSGLVKGKPLAAVPAKALLLSSEEE